MTTLRMLSSDEKHAEIKRLYYETTRRTIRQDLAKALDLLKSMASEEERERAAVYMDGLSQMRSEWARSAKQQKAKGDGQQAEGRRQKAEGRRKKEEGRRQK